MLGPAGAIGRRQGAIRVDLAVEPVEERGTARSGSG